MIEVRCFHDLADAQPFHAAMDALNLASARPDPFSTSAYYAHFLRTRPATAAAAQLWLLLAFEDGALVGYLALKRATHRVLGLPAHKLDLLTAHTADRPHLVARPAHAAAVAAAMYGYLLARRHDWDLLEFQQQDAGSALLELPPAAARGGCHVRSWPNPDTGSIALRWNSLAAYFSALAKKSRSNVSRQMRSLLAAGDVQVISASEPPARAALFELYRAVEARSWKARTEAGFGVHGDGADYYAGLMDPDQPMKIAVQVLLLDGEPIAGLITGAFGRGLYALHIAHDERFDALAPGSAILLMGIRLAIENGYAFFDLLRGSGHYKARWLARMSATRSLQLYRAGSAFHWHRRLGDFRRRVWPAAAADAPRPRAPEPAAPRDAQERGRHAALVEVARRGPAELLSGAALAAVLPFASERPHPGATAPVCGSERMRRAAPP